ncbi:MAG: flagellar basal body-associated FliL family protein [Marinospirillum sp.]|uniref:flagellar basal body-associated FliL family protein n=1 Tax=Marinospirillum sp. TaxID=2183934 RepID=UPI0019E0E28B|nr:flagellar basal body-associated FliL family protein [Marinospirillum sp.]MBE0507036.1 flagellar basal body-associated FliL family protein [Marinospirillum sp.]
MRFGAIYLLLALSLVVTPFSAPAVQASSDVFYIPMQPAFVTNYGGPGRLKYLKVDMTLMVEGGRSAQVIEQQIPLIRNVIVMNLARQNENNVVTASGQERIRQQILQVLQEALQREVGHPVVTEVLFTNFIYQN